MNLGTKYLPRKRTYRTVNNLIALATTHSVAGRIGERAVVAKGLEKIVKDSGERRILDEGGHWRGTRWDKFEWLFEAPCPVFIRIV